MHFLDRKRVPVPGCIARCGPTSHYREFRGADLREIRESLMRIQGGRCAYCERQLADPEAEAHIEHFLWQSGRPDRTVDWTNLFLSCRDESCCGKHKDKCTKTDPANPRRKFDPSDVVHPSSENPELYLRFFSDGSVSPRFDLSERDMFRASETIRVFNLAEAPSLRKGRQVAIRPYQSIVEFLMTRSPTELQVYLDGEKLRIEGLPFETAIKHFFESVSP